MSLTREEIKKRNSMIRQDYAEEDDASFGKLAKKYGISKSAVGKILNSDPESAAIIAARQHTAKTDRSARKTKIVRLIGQGFATKDIAAIIGTSRESVSRLAGMEGLHSPDRGISGIDGSYIAQVRDSLYIGESIPLIDIDRNLYMESVKAGKGGNAVIREIYPYCVLTDIGSIEVIEIVIARYNQDKENMA